MFRLDLNLDPNILIWI